MIVPTGICSDLGTQSLRRLIFDQCQIMELCGFVNNKPIFTDVHRQFKFSTLIYRKGGTTKTFQARFSVIDDNELVNFQKNSFSDPSSIFKTKIK